MYVKWGCVAFLTNGTFQKQGRTTQPILGAQPGGDPPLARGQRGRQRSTRERHQSTVPLRAEAPTCGGDTIPGVGAEMSTQGLEPSGTLPPLKDLINSVPPAIPEHLQRGEKLCLLTLDLLTKECFPLSCLKGAGWSLRFRWLGAPIEPLVPCPGGKQGQ